MNYVKFIRIFLLVLIIIGIGLLLTQKMWVPKVVDMILKNENKGDKTLFVNNISKPAGIVFSTVCQIVGSKGDIDPSSIIPGNPNREVLGDNEWVVDCGNSKNSNARGFFGSVLRERGWKFCNSQTSTGQYWKNSIITAIVESASPSYPFKIVQEKGLDCSS